MPQIIESESVTINLGRNPEIPGRVFFVGSDLNARVRLEAVADELIPVSSVADLPVPPEGVVVVDLDAAGPDVWSQLRSDPGLAERVVGFYSHVSEQLAKDAAAAGVRAYPRGRFWTNLRELLG